MDFYHLHVKSWFSFLRGGSSPDDLAEKAAQLGFTALSLTDHMGLYGIQRFHKACAKFDVKPITGAEITLCNGLKLVLIALNHEGYRNLCSLLTKSHLENRLDPIVSTEDLNCYNAGLICLSGGSNSIIWNWIKNDKTTLLQQSVDLLLNIFVSRFYIEIINHLNQGEFHLAKKLYRWSESNNLNSIATNDVYHTSKDDYLRCDLLNCIRLGIPLNEFHIDRRLNDEAYLKTQQEMLQNIPNSDLLSKTTDIVDQVDLDLLNDRVTAPSAKIPNSLTPSEYIIQLCMPALIRKYQGSYWQALEQLNREIGIITELDLEDFFLVVREVVFESKRRGIRCSGRGSAANSIVAYLLDITGVDPIEHNLLFERFLHKGKKETPDIDIDFDTDRRDEIIEWIEKRFGESHTAMTATLVTYGLKSAVRDIAKSLGFNMQVVNLMSKSLPHLDPMNINEVEERIRLVCQDDQRCSLLVKLVPMLQDCPRNLGLHSGGMVLSLTPLANFTPLQISANGVREVQFDKDDIEAFGLIKLDVLGLRMLSAISEAQELIQSNLSDYIDIDDVPLNDPKIYDYICTGKTLGLFQIESQGQMHLIASHQPRCFDDLISQIALFRPGPLQGGMVHPFIRRRSGQEEITYDHSILEPILIGTYGVILFQEQILEIAHKFAGMPLEEADDFRKNMTKIKNPAKLSLARDKFINGAVSKGITFESAEVVFSKVSNFVGYGFCKSHAAAFAKTVYISAWLKFYYPAAYMAAIMQHHPGMYSLLTLEQEAERLGINVLQPNINISGVRYQLEHQKTGDVAIRKPLTSVKQVSEDLAGRIVWARLAGDYISVFDMVKRVNIPKQSLEFLSLSGSLDDIAKNSREAFWISGTCSVDQRDTLYGDFDKLTHVGIKDIPEFSDFHVYERIYWDLKTQGSSRTHPIAPFRRYLSTIGVSRIEMCYKSQSNSNVDLKLAGTALMKQMPPTAKGMMFICLEDESGFIQCIVSPEVQTRYPDLRLDTALIVEGRIEAKGSWRAIYTYNIFKFPDPSPSTLTKQPSLSKQSQILAATG